MVNLQSEITVYTCLMSDVWTRRRRCTSTASMHIDAILCALVLSAQIGRVSSKMGAISFWLFYGYP